MMILIVGLVLLFFLLLILVITVVTRFPVNYVRSRATINERDQLSRGDITELDLIKSKQTHWAWRQIFYVWYITKYTLTDWSLIYNISTVLFVILGLSIHPFFYCYMLSYPIVQSQILLAVL